MIDADIGLVIVVNADGFLYFVELKGSVFLMTAIGACSLACSVGLVDT